MRSPWVIPLGVWFFGLVAFAGPQAGSELTVITHAQDIRKLPFEEAKRAYPVHLRAVVTFVDTTLGEVFVQDETAGVFVFEHRSFSDATLRVGQLLDVSGETTPADFAPGVTRAHLHLLGLGTLPKPKRRPLDELMDGKEDGQWFELEGVARSGQARGHRLILNIATTGGNFVALMPEFPANWMAKYIDARLALNGVVAAVFNENRQSVGVRMFVQGPEFVKVKQAAPADVFALPASSAVSVGQFRPLQELTQRIRVRATVTGLEPGRTMFLADATGHLEVESSGGCAAQPGDLVDAVGFPGVIDGRLGLLDSLCRKVGLGAPHPVAVVDARAVIPEQVRTDPSGYGFAAGMRYDGSLIRVDGLLLETTVNPEAETMLLRAAGQDFIATLPVFPRRPLPHLEAGSRLQLTGVCLVRYDSYHRAQFFRVLLRGPEDIGVLSRPSWWTLTHSLWIASLLTVICLAASAWIFFLRHQVAMQTRQLRQANERLTELSTHDSLTHAFNRRQFDKVLEAEAQRSARTGRPVSLVMMDLDHFKDLNDRCGHQSGDDCLIRVVRKLEESVRRSSDLVARYGGEEFAVVLPETDQAGAIEIAESMRAAVAGLAFLHAGLGEFPVTISAGVTTAQGEVSAASLVRAADRALYEAKRRGRNCVVHLETKVTDYFLAK